MFPRICLTRLLTVYFRPFHVVEKPDGRPAVEVDVGGKKQQFVSLLSLDFPVISSTYYF